MFQKLGTTTVVIILFLLTTEQVFAHASPVTYEPKSALILEKAPERVLIHFSERIEPGASSIIIFGPDGSRADNDSPLVDETDPHFFSVGVKEAGEGTYTVSWQVVSADDGHFTKGAYVFSLGKETPSAGVVDSQNTFSVIHSSAITEGIMVWIELLGQAVLLGCLISLFFWRRLVSRFGNEFSSFAGIYRNRFSFSIVFGVFLILAGTLSYLLLQSRQLAELQNTTFINGLNSFRGTVAGSFALYRALVSLVFLVVFWVTSKKIFTPDDYKRKEIALFMLLFLIFLMRARVSHAAASHFYPLFSVAINFIHLIFKDAWAGSLLAAGFLLFPILKQFEKASLLLNNFLARFLSVALGFVGVTGIYIVWLHLKEPSNIFTTDWGMRFVPLLTTAAVLILLRLFHQIVIEKFGQKREWFRFSFPLETIVGILVLFFSSLLIITTPPLKEKMFERSAVDQGAKIVLTKHGGQYMLISINDEKTKSSLSVTDIVVTLFNEEKSIGPIVAETQKMSEGGFMLPVRFLSPPGAWKMQIAVRHPHSYDANAEFKINYPDEFKQRIILETREFGAFEWLLIFLALGSIVFSWVLYQTSRAVHNSFEADIGSAPTVRPLAVPDNKHWLISLAAVLIICAIIWGIYNSLMSKNHVSCPPPLHSSHGEGAPCY